MSVSGSRFRPPFCPNPACRYHDAPTASWRWVRSGFFRRDAAPQRIQRFQCRHCRRHFSTQTFRGDYWLKRPRLLLPVAHRLVGCSGFRQIAREFEVSPQTVLGLSARIGRQCLLFFAINLFDLLVRHSGANHKRETIAFSKRRQSAAERLWLTLVWRNYVKWFSERKRDATPAMRAGVCEGRWSLAGILAERRLISRVRLPERWERYYWGLTPTRGLPRTRAHTLRYAA